MTQGPNAIQFNKRTQNQHKSVIPASMPSAHKGYTIGTRYWHENKNGHHPVFYNPKFGENGHVAGYAHGFHHGFVHTNGKTVTVKQGFMHNGVHIEPTHTNYQKLMKEARARDFEVKKEHAAGEAAKLKRGSNGNHAGTFTVGTKNSVHRPRFTSGGRRLRQHHPT